jgi:hypothetical protein
MGRNKKNHHPAISSDFQVVYESADGHNADTPTAEGEPQLEAAPEVDTVNVPSEIVQEIWESLKEEFYERESSMPDCVVSRSFEVVQRSNSYHCLYIGRLL